MKRKLILLIGTFVLLFFAFGVYQLFVPSVAPFFDATKNYRRRPTFPRTVGDPGIDVIRKMSFEDRNSLGVLRGVYEVVTWKKQDDGSFYLEKPRAVVFHGDGQRTYMSADNGTVWAEEVDKGINIRHGRLDGNVKIYFDQSRTIGFRKHPRDRTQAERTRDCIDISLDYVTFSRDMLEIKTDSQITLWSRTIDILGRGLRIHWNETPRELRLLEIAHGDVMVIKELPEQVDMIQLPTQTTTTKPAVAAATTTKPALAATTTKPAVAAKSPATQPSTMDVAGVGVRRSGSPTTMAVVVLDTDDRKMRNIYQAKFDKNIRIHSGQRKLLGADVLALKFEWDRAWRQDQEEKTKQQPTTAAAEKEKKDDQKIAGGKKDKKPKKIAKSPAPAAGKVEDGSTPPQDQDNRMEIYWDGPLTIRPVGRTPAPSRKRYKISGKGKRVILSDVDTNIVCRKFAFENPQQKATFMGDKSQPAELSLARGERVVCEKSIQFDRSIGQALLDGAGTMTRYATSGEGLTEEKRPVSELIAWGGKVEATFGEREVIGPNGKKSVKPYIEDATFFKSVELDQAPAAGAAGAARGDSIKCEWLKIWMSDDKSGKVRPSRAEARGSVHGWQQGSDVRAERVEVTFVPKAKAVGTKPTAGKDEAKQSPLGLASAGGVEAERLKAWGDVRIEYTDPKKPQDPPLHVRAEKIDANMKESLAVLIGQPAKIWQGANSIEGETIHFDEDAEAVRVTGAGQVKFTTNQDLSGQKLRKKRPLRVSWTRSMLYHGRSGQAKFDGDVDLKSSREVMQCRQMRLFFEQPPATIAAIKSTKKKPRRSLSLGVERYSRRKISRIEAEGGKGDTTRALMQSCNMHPKNPVWLQRRVELRADKVLYDAISGDTYVIGAGTFLSEDYRPPEKKAEAPRRLSAPAGVGGQIDRPSQTLFAWKKSMFLSQKHRHVNLQKDVTMIHRSGNEVLVIRGMKTEPWGELEKGRKTKLRCENMDAWFDEPEPSVNMKSESPDKTDLLLAAGPRLGPLKMFSAVLDVTFEDGPYKIDGQKILYSGQTPLPGTDEKLRVVTVWGYLPDDKRRTNARITYEDPETKRVQAWESPTLVYDMTNEKIRTEKMEGGGGL